MTFKKAALFLILGFSTAAGIVQESTEAAEVTAALPDPDSAVEESTEESSFSKNDVQDTDGDEDEFDDASEDSFFEDDDVDADEDDDEDADEIVLDDEDDDDADEVDDGDADDTAASGTGNSEKSTPDTKYFNKDVDDMKIMKAIQQSAEKLVLDEKVTIGNSISGKTELASAKTVLAKFLKEVELVDRHAEKLTAKIEDKQTKEGYRRVMKKSVDVAKKMQKNAEDARNLLKDAQDRLENEHDKKETAFENDPKETVKAKQTLEKVLESIKAMGGNAKELVSLAKERLEMEDKATGGNTGQFIEEDDGEDEEDDDEEMDESLAETDASEGEEEEDEDSEDDEEELLDEGDEEDEEDEDEDESFVEIGGSEDEDDEDDEEDEEEADEQDAEQVDTEAA